MTTLPSYSLLRIIITSGLDTEPCVFATSSVKLFGRFIMITSATLSTFTDWQTRNCHIYHQW